MSITFVHTADWQLGKPFAGFEPEVAARLAAAREDAIGRLAEVARTAGAGHVLVAGDVFDSERAGEPLLRSALRRMANHPDLRWHLISGNHDPARPGGVWSRLVPLGLPANVVLHLMPEIAEIAPGVALLPAPLAVRETSTDPTGWMNAATTPPGIIRIGLAHGSVQGFGSLGEAAVPVSPRRRDEAGLAYLALGDWHGTKRIADGVWYSGTPEPDSFADNDPGQALVVRIGGPAAPPEIHPVATAEYRWLARRQAMSRLDDLAPVEEAVARLGAGAHRHLLALTLEGAVPATEMAALESRLHGLAGALVALTIERRALRISATPDELARLGSGSEGLERIAHRLATSADGDGPEAATAGRALQILFALAAPAAEEAA